MEVKDMSNSMSENDRNERNLKYITRPDWQNNDLHGHGTHCAGTVASGPYGVAKASKVIAVKVLADDGEGLASWL